MQRYKMEQNGLYEGHKSCKEYGETLINGICQYNDLRNLEHKHKFRNGMEIQWGLSSNEGQTSLKGVDVMIKVEEISQMKLQLSHEYVEENEISILANENETIGIWNNKISVWVLDIPLSLNEKEVILVQQDGEDGEDGESSEGGWGGWHPTQFQLTIWLLHEQFMFYAWGIFVDIAIIISRNFKVWKWYMMCHGILFLLIDLGTVIIAALTLAINTNPLSQIVTGLVGQHFIAGSLLCLFVVLQHITGLVIQFKYIDPLTGIRDKYTPWHKFHVYLGQVSYILGKYICITGEMLLNKTMTGIILVVVSMAVRLMMETLHIKKPNLYIKALKRNPKRNYKKQSNQDLVQMLKNGARKSEIFDTFPEKKYCIYGNKVCDMDPLTHPGGNYITEKCVGREVDCYLFGGYAHETTKRDPWDHSEIAYIFLNNHEMGSVYQPRLDPVYVKGKSSATPYSLNKDTMDTGDLEESFTQQPNQKSLLAGEVSYPQRQDEGLYYSVLKNRELYTEDTGICEFSLYDGKQQYQVKNDMQGVEWMGRFFTIKQKSKWNKKRCYTTVLSYTKRNQRLREDISNLARNGFNGTISPSNYEKYNDTLPMLIKDYNLKSAFSTFLFNEDQKACKCEYEIEGPYGLGLQINQESRGNYLIVCGGTGLFPFVDLLDFVLRKLIYTAAAKTKGSDYADKYIDFNNQGLKQNLNHFKLSIYGSFASSSNFVGRDLLLAINDIDKKYKLNMVNITLRFTDKSTLQDIRCVKNRFNEEFFNQEFNDEITGYSLIDIQQAWLCGPPPMMGSMADILPYYMNENDMHYI